MRMRFQEWWSRALVPGQHYVEVTDSEEEMCDKVRAVRTVCTSCLRLQAGGLDGVHILLKPPTRAGLSGQPWMCRAAFIVLPLSQRRRCFYTTCSSSPSLPLQTAQVVRDMNAAFASPAGRAAVPSTGLATPTLTKRLDQLRSDRKLAHLLGLDGGSSSAAAAASLGRAGAAGSGAQAEASDAAAAAEQGPVAGPGGEFSWGSARMPWEVAAAGQQFVQEHVRMEDALVYIR